MVASNSDNIAAAERSSSGPIMMMTPIIGGSNASTGEASAPVPDVLLSLAKDDRYVSEVFSLLSRAIVPFASIYFVPRRSSNGDRTVSSSSNNNSNTRSRDFNAEETLEDDGKQFVERIRPELNLLASILVYSATFVFYTRNFDGGDLNNVGVQRSIGMESLNLSYRLPPGKIRRLLFLQTVVPYVINRVGRGGWSQDLDGLVSTLLETCGLRQMNRSTTREESEPNNESDGSAIRNDDMLRGSARRRLFLEQRRLMMNSSNDNQLSPLFASEDSDDNSGENIMVQQNQVQRDNTSLSERSENTTTTVAKRWNQLSRSSWKITQCISHALSSLSHGAHQLPRHIGSIENLDKYTKIIKWLFRLHLAVFYWSGVYPTITHRIAGAKIRDSTPPSATISSLASSSGAVVANRPSYKPIAALIFVQAASALLQTAASASIELAHKLQIAYFRWNRRGITHARQRGRISFNETESEREEYLDLIEARVPGIDSSSKESKTSSQKKSKSNKEESESHHPCGICLNERIHSAAPSKCGHVFCWNCILHWVVNVREECPLCRASTRPQDVIPLYNYA